MLKVSFLGNCQLEKVAELVKLVCQQHTLEIDVLWTRGVYITKPEEFMQVMTALENSDIIYAQYHDKGWGLFSTPNIQQSFDVRIVPTLESFVSVPQTGSWGVQPLMATVGLDYLDFRMLDLYLKNVPVEEAPKQYFHVYPRAGAIEKEIQRMVEKYRDYFKTGKVVFDYSTVYETAMEHNLQSFHTFNHPNNKQLEWMLNSIMADMGVNMTLNIDGPELIGQFYMPSLIGGQQDTHVIMNKVVPMPMAAKIFYTYCHAIDRDILTHEFARSPYYALMDVG